MKRAIVVGSGAGGALAARELTAGFDVTILEAGPEFKRFDRDIDRLAKLRPAGVFVDPRQISWLFPAMRVGMTPDRMALVRGMATGGTTTVATGNALRCDEALQQIGIDLGAEFSALKAELPISAAHRDRWRPVTRQLFGVCEQMGLGPAVTPKLGDYSHCTRCGRCVFGCPSGAKWDSRDHVRQAEAKGARLVTGATVERLATDGTGPEPGRATGVWVRRGRRTEFMEADLVVLAAGGLGTPEILARSGVATQERLFVDPVLCVAGPAPGCRQDQEVPMPFVVEGDGYIISPYFDQLSFFFERSWRHPRQDIVSLMIKLADRESGSVGGGRRGRVTKILAADDWQRLGEATVSCVEILSQVGVPRDSVFLGMLNAGHPGGTLPLTGRERAGLHADVLPGNVYVADASLLPRSLGKPPSLTIMALAKRIAGLCLERLA